MLLTTVEKYDGINPGFATAARMLLDRGVACKRAAELLNARFQTSVTESAVKRYRTRRWLPERIKRQEETRAIDRACNEAGLDQMAFARIRELLESADIKEANAICLTLLKLRAQDLKETESRFKRDQQLDAAEAANECDATVEDAKTKEVMNKVRAIFALPALPEDEAEAAQPVAPNAQT